MEPAEEEEKENDPYKENLVLLQVRAHLLPSILKKKKMRTLFYGCTLLSHHSD
jgi:hypothetical protein